MRRLSTYLVVLSLLAGSVSPSARADDATNDAWWAVGLTGAALAVCFLVFTPACIEGFSKAGDGGINGAVFHSKDACEKKYGKGSCTPDGRPTAMFDRRTLKQDGANSPAKENSDKAQAADARESVS